jgi:hypothetical protein
LNVGKGTLVAELFRKSKTLGGACFAVIEFGARLGSIEQRWRNYDIILCRKTVSNFSNMRIYAVDFRQNDNCAPGPRSRTGAAAPLS